MNSSIVGLAQYSIQEINEAIKAQYKFQSIESASISSNSTGTAGTEFNLLVSVNSPNSSQPQYISLELYESSTSKYYTLVNWSFVNGTGTPTPTPTPVPTPTPTPIPGAEAPVRRVVIAGPQKQHALHPQKKIQQRVDKNNK